MIIGELPAGKSDKLGAGPMRLERVTNMVNVKHLQRKKASYIPDEFMRYISKVKKYISKSPMEQNNACLPLPIGDNNR